MDKVLSLLDVLLTPLVGIVPSKVRKAVYAAIPVVVAILGALVSSGLLSGQIAIWIGGAYSVLAGLTAAANTNPAKPAPKVVTLDAGTLQPLVDKITAVGVKVDKALSVDTAKVVAKKAAPAKKASPAKAAAPTPPVPPAK